jgi:uncharacterized protein
MYAPGLPSGVLHLIFRWFDEWCKTLFLTDEMLTGLARWLRAAGHDTRAAPAGAADGALVALAASEGRLLLTRDRAILDRKAAVGLVLVLEGAGLNAWAMELACRIDLDWMAAPFTRCLLCNAPLEDPPRDYAAPRDAVGPVRWCPCCGKAYWRGGHVRRMERRLSEWGSATFRGRGDHGPNHCPAGLLSVEAGRAPPEGEIETGGPYAASRHRSDPGREEP